MQNLNPYWETIDLVTGWLMRQPDHVLWVGALLVLAILIAAFSPRKSRRKAERKLRGSRHKQYRREAKRALQEVKDLPGEYQRVLGQMDPYAFEYLLIDLFSQSGYKTRKIERCSGDGGIDGMVHYDGKWRVLQAKRYQGAIGSGMIKDFIDTTYEWKMPGLFVTSSTYTTGARAIGQRVARLDLMDGRDLVKMILKTK